MTAEDIQRLVSIYTDLDQQYKDGISPIMILASISDDDLEFIRSHLDLVCWGYQSDQYWGNLLMSYAIIDCVYENYAQDSSENTNLWPMVIRYFSKNISLDRSELVDIVMKTIQDCKLPQIDYGNPYQNTVLLHSSSKYYSSRFFNLILGQYDRNLEGKVGFDLRDVALSISESFSKDSVKVNQMSHSFGLMIKDEKIFPEVFERIIRKIDQRRNSTFEFDLGRWESAFDEWYSDANSSKFTRNKAEVSLEDFDGEYYLSIKFPSNRGVPLKGYGVKLTLNGESSIIDLPVRNKKNVGYSMMSKPIRFPIQNVDIFNRITAVDSTGVSLLDLDASDFRFFGTSGRLINNPTSGQYKALIRYGVKHDLSESFSDRISDDIVLIFTKLERGNEYRIGNKIIVSEGSISKNSLQLKFPTEEGRFIQCDERPHVLSAHPIILVDEDVDSLRVTLKDFAGRYVYNDIITLESEEIDVNELAPSGNGVYTLTLTYQKYRLASVKYLVVEDLTYHPDKAAVMPSEGILYIHSKEGDSTIPYTDRDMYAHKDFIINGKPFDCMFRTPNVFFNPSPDRDDNNWIPAGTEDFDNTELGSSLGVSLGCVPDGEPVRLFIRSPLGTEQVASETFEGECYFNISDYVDKILSKKYHFGIEVQFRGHFYTLFSVKTKGKYDIDVCNGLAVVTPYRLPAGCFARFEYHSFSDPSAGYLELNKTELFDVSVPCYLFISETDTDTNNEIIVFEKNSMSIQKPNLSSKLEDLPPYLKATYLLNGNGCKPDVYGALEILQQLCEQGDPMAMYKLGLIYMNGRLINTNLSKAAD